MSNIPFVELSRIILLAQALFIGLYAAVYTLRTPLGRTLVAFGFCAAAEVILRFTWRGWELGWLYYVAVLGTSAFPAVVWLTTQYVFDDSFRTGRRFWILIALYLTLNLLGRLAYADREPPFSWQSFLIFYLPQLIKLGFAAHIIVIALGGLKADLVEPRRRLRAPAALATGLTVALVLGSQLLNQNYRVRVAPGFEAVFNVVLAYGITLAIFRLRFSVESPLPQPPPVAASPVEYGASGSLQQKLLTLMTEQHVYRQPGLTIGALAETLAEPEYRLRRTINGELGFRNFNQYINAWRIKDAERRLVESDASVLSIAMDLGYQSLSSFNKAFRELTRLSPTEYRAQRRKTPRTTADPGG